MLPKLRAGARHCVSVGIPLGLAALMLIGANDGLQTASAEGDTRIKTIMHTDERRVADVAPPQDPKRELATMKSNQEILNRVERREASNPLQFFERLFR